MCFDCAIILIYYTLLYTLSLQYLLSIINTFMHSIIDEQSQTDYSLYCSAQVYHACSPAIYCVPCALNQVFTLKHP